MNTETLDATNKKLGRLASKVAHLLMGKDSPAYKPHLVHARKVKVENVSKMDISSKKEGAKTYERYSGYPGGLKSERLEEVIEKKGHGEVLKRAVYGMLPKNRLRDQRIMNLEIEE